MKSFSWHGITLRAGMHLWSNPRRCGTEAALPTVMRAPTLFDLVVLAEQWAIAELECINDQLLARGEITVRQHANTQDFLDRIANSNRARATVLCNNGNRPAK
ncbi:MULTISPECIES: hypothetical protein [Cupriavidus]|uniref:hypothetical protein n=1 Tax=Cupriavidus TaxID=106589 RepID=UPI000E10E79A|nr:MULTISPECIES: hypothetical protein [Cupriavidus]NOV26640.1 hypothetical protein [Cupriavidus necator]NSX13236.1 hypothetical protein [Cupriavidus taiwanensis]SOZ18868.1 hypothetical protein CBM2597_U30040 [Cupriavidus taiwanensis]SOZ96983.1 hypothetical protein CBM2598_U30042 [Cupriavidus taiwanensis]SPD38034.1 protein of unknown function [Cupriavidus taiwanensis]